MICTIYCQWCTIQVSFPYTEVVKIEAQPDPPTSNPSSSQLLSSNDLPLGSLASQLCPLGPKDRCTPSQAQAMGQQVLALMAMHEANAISLPCKRNYIENPVINFKLIFIFFNR